MTDKGCIQDLFFALIRCSVGTADKLPYAPSKEEWSSLYDLVKKQALQGVTFAAIEKLPEEQRPNLKILLPWYKTCEIIKKKNAELTKKAILISKKFQEEGFKNCILKGQGIAQYYHNPDLRVSGDIDIWLEGDCDRIIKYIKDISPNSRPMYQHIDFHIYDDIEIETHYRPSWLCNPFYNKKLQLFFKETAENQLDNTIATKYGDLHTPSIPFNVVYIQMHIFRHLFDEGIGFRQIMDYYYLLKQKPNEQEKEKCLGILKNIGQIEFTRALMYIMKEVFDIEDEYLLIEPNKRYGIFLLNEIMLAGNLGQYDKRYKQSKRGFSFTRLSVWTRRFMQLIAYSPNEAIWDPYFKIRHFFWRLQKNKKYK